MSYYRSRSVCRMGARVIGLLFLCIAIVSGTFAQKPAHPEIRELQGPQDPRVGFMILVRVQGAPAADAATGTTKVLQQVTAKANTDLSRGAAARIVVAQALKGLVTLPRTNALSGAVALDRKGRIAAARSSATGLSTYTSAFCGSVSLGDADSATAACTNVERKALTVQKGLEIALTERPAIGIVVIDKFGNMALSKPSGNIYRAYIGSDGKAVVEAASQ